MPIWKRKSDVQDLGKYSGIAALIQAIKVMERILDGRIMKRVRWRSEKSSMGLEMVEG